MNINSLIIFLVIGALSGWLAGNIMKGKGFGVIGRLGFGFICFPGLWLRYNKIQYIDLLNNIGGGGVH